MSHKHWQQIKDKFKTWTKAAEALGVERTYLAHIKAGSDRLTPAIEKQICKVMNWNYPLMTTRGTATNDFEFVVATSWPPQKEGKDE